MKGFLFFLHVFDQDILLAYSSLNLFRQWMHQISLSFSMEFYNPIDLLDD